jgi:hypothetical protein
MPPSPHCRIQGSKMRTDNSEKAQLPEQLATGRALTRWRVSWGACKKSRILRLIAALSGVGANRIGDAQLTTSDTGDAA